jgi:hypothetical protein
MSDFAVSLGPGLAGYPPVRWPHEDMLRQCSGGIVECDRESRTCSPNHRVSIADQGCHAWKGPRRAYIGVQFEALQISPGGSLACLASHSSGYEVLSCGPMVRRSQDCKTPLVSLGTREGHLKPQMATSSPTSRAIVATSSGRRWSPETANIPLVFVMRLFFTWVEKIAVSAVDRTSDRATRR